ncbi:MAG: hypothetical protein H6658_06140 [Ardenticatenaceae bacterium]|nr:hypothetical protein [Ardenticatenaceae bacterium]
MMDAISNFEVLAVLIVSAVSLIIGFRIRRSLDRSFKEVQPHEPFTKQENNAADRQRIAGLLLLVVFVLSLGTDVNDKVWLFLAVILLTYIGISSIKNKVTIVMHSRTWNSIFPEPPRGKLAVFLGYLVIGLAFALFLYFWQP